MKKVLFFFVFLGMVSCSLNEWDDVPDCMSENDPFSVSMTDALSIASSFMTEREIIPLTRAEDLSVISSFSIKDKRNNPLFHVVNYNGGGFAIIAGDMRLTPIQAYSSTGFFNDTIESYPLGLKIWLDCAEASRDNVMENGEESDYETLLAWTQYKSTGFDLEGCRTRSLDPIIGPSQEEVDTLVGPLINDSWHQGSPYNDSLLVSSHYHYYYDPYYNQNDSTYAGQYRPVVGCVPLAIARVMRYNAKPYNYAWSFMPNNAPQTIATRSYVRDIHYAVKAYAENHGFGFRYAIIDGQPATGVDNAFPIGSFLCNQYGYPAAITNSYTSGAYGIIGREMIDHHLVCILSGNSSSGGHTWVCDGYHFHSTPVFGYNGEFMGAFENKYLHHRWGWENCDFDGWFQYYDFSPGPDDFHESMKITHRIAEIDYWSFGL